MQQPRALGDQLVDARGGIRPVIAGADVARLAVIEAAAPR